MARSIALSRRPPTLEPIGNLMTRATRFRSTVKKCTLAIGLAAAPLGAQSPGRPAQPFPDDLDRYLSDVVARWQIPGMAIAIVRNDSTLITKGYGVRIGPVFSTSREDCRSVVAESIPLDLICDMQRGEVGSFFIWDRKEAGA